jgi:hypothetical protein
MKNRAEEYKDEFVPAFITIRIMLLSGIYHGRLVGGSSG